MRGPEDAGDEIPIGSGEAREALLRPYGFR
jgi:hypothetical protein